jgi:hypothetical protein
MKLAAPSLPPDEPCSSWFLAELPCFENSRNVEIIKNKFICLPKRFGNKALQKTQKLNLYRRAYRLPSAGNIFMVGCCTFQVCGKRGIFAGSRPIFRGFHLSPVAQRPTEKELRPARFSTRFRCDRSHRHADGRARLL